MQRYAALNEEVELEIDSHGRKLAESLQPAQCCSSHYLISRCDSTVIKSYPLSQLVGSNVTRDPQEYCESLDTKLEL